MNSGVSSIVFPSGSCYNWCPGWFPSLYVFLSVRELCHVLMGKSVAKKIRRKSQREALRLQEQADTLLAMEEDEEVLFKRPAASTDTPSGSRANSPDREENGPEDYTTVLEMVKAVRDRLTELVLDNTNIRAACDDLRRQCHSQGVAFGDLSRLVSQTRADQEETRAYAREETGPHPSIRSELLDARGNLRARDIGITWRDGDTFLHGVRIAGQNDDMEDNHRRPATAAPYPSCPQQQEDARRQPVMSTPYHQSHGHPPNDVSPPGFPRPVCIEMSDTPTHNFAGPRQEGRPTHRPAAPIQRFNSKSIGWPAWFRHFRAVADVQGWDKDQRALQMVSYLDEKAMNVAQELSDRELYDYDALVGLLSARFDPASRVSASRSRFHGRTRRHQEDADTYADSITELCRLGYPQSSPELRQELISEQFVRGQSDPELKKYLWVVIRTQKDKKTTDTNRGLYRLRQLESYDRCSPSGGAGVRDGGGSRGGDVRRGGPTAVEHTEGGGTTFVTGAAADVCSCASHGLRDATDRTTPRRSSTGSGPSVLPE